MRAPPFLMNIKLFDDKIEKFIYALEESTIARVLRTIDILEMFGSRLGPPHSKKVESGLFELRIRGQQEVRIFYTFRGGEAILLHGFIKKSRRIPARELKVALFKLKILDSR